MTTFRRLRCLDPRSRRSLPSLPSLPSLARSVRRILSRTKTPSNKRVFCLCYCQLFLFTPSSSHPTRMKRSTQLIFLWFLAIQFVGTCMFLITNMNQWFGRGAPKRYIYQTYTWNKPVVDKSPARLDADQIRTEIPREEMQIRETERPIQVKPTTAYPVTPKPTSAKTYRIKKSRLKRVIRHRDDGTVVPLSSLTSINHNVVEPILYSEPPIESVHYTSAGFVNTKRNRIDFMKSNWYAQFQYLRELIGKQSPVNETLALQWSSSFLRYSVLMYSAHGETIGNYSVNYAVLANACVLPTTGLIQFFGDKGRHVSAAARQVSSTRDFYFSPIQTVDLPLSPQQLPSRGNHTAVFRPRSFQNIYHFFEGSSQMIRIAMHPELFPPVAKPSKSHTDRSRGDGRPVGSLSPAMVGIHGLRLSGSVFSFASSDDAFYEARYAFSRECPLLRSHPFGDAQLGL